MQANPTDRLSPVTSTAPQALSLRLLPWAVSLIGLALLARAAVVGTTSATSLSAGRTLIERLIVTAVAVIATLLPAVVAVVLTVGTVRRRSRAAYRWLTGVVTACLLLTAYDSAATLARPTAHLGGRSATETELLGLLIAAGTAVFLIGLVSALVLLAMPSTRRSLNPR